MKYQTAFKYIFLPLYVLRFIILISQVIYNKDNLLNIFPIFVTYLAEFLSVILFFDARENTKLLKGVDLLPYFIYTFMLCTISSYIVISFNNTLDEFYNKIDNIFQVPDNLFKYLTVYIPHFILFVVHSALFVITSIYYIYLKYITKKSDEDYEIDETNDV